MMEVDKISSEKDNKMENDQPKFQQRRKRGKQSLQKYRDDRRRFKNATIGRSVDEDIQSKLFPEVEPIVRAMKALQIQPQKATIPLSITTRAIGLLAEETFAEVRAIEQKAITRSGCDVHALYRVSLAQVTASLTQSARSAMSQPPTVYVPGSMSDRLMPEEMIQRFATVQGNFRVLANVFGSVGRFEHDGVDYCPVISANNDALFSAPARLEKRRKVVAEISDTAIPDPFTVTILNLPNVVKYLTSPESDPDKRAAFRRYSPIPGAAWDEHDFIVNGATILPPNYLTDPDAQIADIRMVNSLLQNVNQRRNWTTGVELNGKGDARCLASTRVMAPLPTATIDVTSMRPLPETTLIFGGLALVGESPPTRFWSPLYSSRVMAAVSIPLQWRSVIMSTFQQVAQ